MMDFKIYQTNEREQRYRCACVTDSLRCPGLSKWSECVLLCFIKPILGNRYVRSRGFIVESQLYTIIRWRVCVTGLSSVMTSFQSGKHKENLVLKPILKSVSSYAKRAHAQPASGTEEYKRQRVRFFHPSSQHHIVQDYARMWDPEGTVVSTWSSILVLPMAYEGWAGGFRLALGTPQEEWIRWLDVVSDCFFLLDGCVFLNTSLKPQEKSFINALTPTDPSLETADTNRWYIAKLYFQNVFPFMILPSILYLGVTFMATMDEQPQTQGTNSLWLWWLSSLPRLFFRVQRMKNYFSAMEMNLSVSVSSLHVVKFALMIFLSAHW